MEAPVSTTWKTYKASIFGRKESGFRGIRSGFGPFEQRRDYIRDLMNFDTDDSALHTRTGTIRRNQFPATISSVAVMDTAKAASTGGSVYVERRNELFTMRTPISQLLNRSYVAPETEQLEGNTYPTDKPTYAEP
jgi:hypothetical protein